YFTNFNGEKKSGMWVGSDNGIYQFNEKADHFDHYLAEADPARQHRFGLAGHSTEPGILWLSASQSGLGSANKDQGLWRYNIKTKSVTIFRHSATDSTSIANDRTRWINVDSLGRLWVSTDKGLSLFIPEKNNFINYYLKDTIKGIPVIPWEIRSDKNNDLWLTADQGLVFFDTKARAFTRYLANEKDPYGLVSDNGIHSLFIDHSGILWFGVGQIGLQWINKQLSRFIQYKDDPGKPHHFPGGVVNSFAESKDKSLWLASANGLYHWQPQTDLFTLIKPGKAQGKYFYTSKVMVDKEGRVWYGGGADLDAGLYCFDPKTGHTQYFNNNKKDAASLSDNDVSALMEDHLGNIWVGTNRGGICLFREQSQNFARYPYIENTGFIQPDNGVLDDAGVTTIYEDKSGTLWVGTNNGGLNKFNRQTGAFTSYNNLLPGFSRVTCIQEDTKNRLWVGTYFGGVFNFDPETHLAKEYSDKDGLLYDGANGIFEDNKENLWLATPRGISIFNPQTKQVRNLTTANGLPSENLITAFKTGSGQFLFSGNDGGFISLRPNDFSPDLHPPVVHIKSVSFTTSDAGKTKDSTIFTYGKDSIKLHYDENRLSFNYVGLYYQNPKLIQYAYKLDGYDKDWIPAGTQRLVTYTNLSPGHYTFHVKAANSDEVWNEQGASFAFTILPPWWKTWWAYILYILVLAIAVWAFASYRSRKLRHVNQLLEDKVEHRTSQLNKSIENLKSTQNQLIQSEKMASLGELTAGIAHEIQNPLNFVNNFSEVSRELLSEMKTELDNGNITDASEIASDVMQNLEKINHHGKRADAIVKGMLQHSRSSSGVKELTDINALADEYLKLSYHGLRAKDKNLTADFKTDFDNALSAGESGIGKINIIPQDIGRVLLNLYNNAFYATTERKKTAGEHYKPLVSISTKKINDKVEIRVTDNGKGIPQNIVDKIFQPFFTTKPTGQGTGLGLSLSYDIIKAHGGEIKVESKEGEGTTFIIELPNIA
ncbi:MAG: two-component regulator propeller domain-containing protein, partial [Ferruginibacter sp.]